MIKRRRVPLCNPVPSHYLRRFGKQFGSSGSKRDKMRAREVIREMLLARPVLVEREVAGILG